MNKNITVISGCKWGDEGKGKIASMQSKDAKVVVRATGGDNAGHTVIYNGKKLALHLIPGGIVYPQTTCIIGPGTLLNPKVLLSEIKLLKEHGIPDVENRLKISGRAHVIFPYHQNLDELYEMGKIKPVGTTKRGIGPTVIDKANRVGIRMYDLLRKKSELRALIKQAIKFHNQLFKKNSMPKCVEKPNELAELYHKYGKQLRPYITNVDPIITNAIKNDDKIVVEGAQAFRLDPDNGDYPMCTSSNCVTAGSLCGGALPPNALNVSIGIDKAYNSRVGNGIFPTEEPASIDESGNIIPDAESLPGDIIRNLGHEYGTTTKRPRRCGWMDCPILYSARYTSGIDYLCINHLDTLGKIGNKLGYIKVCIGYEYQGKKIGYFPDDTNLTHEVPTPIYQTLDGGWDLDSSCKSYNDLPELAKEFIKIVEEYSEIPVKYIGTGPANDDLIIRDDI